MVWPVNVWFKFGRYVMRLIILCYFELVMTYMLQTVTMLDKYVDRYVCIVNYHVVMIVACCLSNFGQNMD
jgi:hypothetical protein